MFLWMVCILVTLLNLYPAFHRPIVFYLYSLQRYVSIVYNTSDPLHMLFCYAIYPFYPILRLSIVHGSSDP